MTLTQIIAILSEQYAINKIQHWASSNYQQHIILDEFNDKYLEIYDKIAEELISTNPIESGKMTLEVDLPTKGRYTIQDTATTLNQQLEVLLQFRATIQHLPVLNLVDDLIMANKNASYKLQMLNPQE